MNLSAMSWLSDASAGRSHALSTSASSWDYRDGSLCQTLSPERPAGRAWGQTGSPYGQVRREGRGRFGVRSVRRGGRKVLVRGRVEGTSDEGQGCFLVGAVGVL